MTRRHFVPAALAFLALLAFPAFAQGLRFATYNVWGLPAPLLTLPQRFAEIRDQIPGLNADVIGFNETFAGQTNVLAAVKGYRYVARGPGGGGLLKQSSGLLLISRHPIVAQGIWKYSVCQGNDCLANKGILFVRIQPNSGPTVNVFITHTNAENTEPVRVRQIQELLAFIRSHDDGNPVVVMGDFNTTEGSDSYNLLTQDEGLLDTHKEWIGAPTQQGLSPNAIKGLTYVTNRSTDPAVLEKGWRFDYIFARSKRTVAVSESQVIFKSPVNGHYLSDHYGYLAELEL